MDDYQLETLETAINSIHYGVKTVQSFVKPVDEDTKEQNLIKVSNDYIQHTNERMNKVSNCYTEFEKVLTEATSKYLESLQTTFNESQEEFQSVNTIVEKFKNDTQLGSKQLGYGIIDKNKVPKIIYRSNNEYEIDVELIEKYPTSYFYKEYISNRRTDSGDIYMDHDDINRHIILKYMRDEDIDDDIKNMTLSERQKLIEDISFFDLPVKSYYINKICFDEERMKMEAWRKRVIMINGKNTPVVNHWLKKNNQFDNFFNKQSINSIKYFQKNNVCYINIHLVYSAFILDYMNNNELHTNLFSAVTNNNVEDLEQELMMFDIHLNSSQRTLLLNSMDLRFFKDSKIVTTQQYDQKLMEWLGKQYRWKRIFRASEHNFSAREFHKACDDKGPTLILIQSKEGWIFGGYTSKSWKFNNKTPGFVGNLKCDPNAFLFTLKNAHNILPTKYMKRSETPYSLWCQEDDGPSFYGINCCDLCLGDKCTEEKSCFVDNDGEHGYDCDSKYKKSLFTNTDKPEERNYFSVIDYEVYTIDNLKDYIKNTCKYPELITNYIHTNTIDTKLLKPIHDDFEIFQDFSKLAIPLDFKNKLIVSDYYLHPSKLFPNTHIMDEQYDTIFKQWIGTKYQWKLAFRASEHGYLADSFHDLCDTVGPTVVIIKSSEGWIFGGYCAKNWTGNDIVKYDPTAFLFTLKNPHNIPPTKYKVLSEKSYAINCDPSFGPIFSYAWDLCIANCCDKENSSWTLTDGTHGFECDPMYRATLFVDTSTPTVRNYFSVFEYEVYCLTDYQKYLQDISINYVSFMYDYSLSKTFDIDNFIKRYGTKNDSTLVTLCKDSLAVGIDTYELINSIEKKYSTLYLNDSSILNGRSNYLNALKSWINTNYKWKLIHKASRYGFIQNSFHKNCDNKGPTLILVKSSQGYIFGGYTTQSWKVDIPDTDGDQSKEDNEAFIFTLYNPHGVVPTRYNRRSEFRGAITCVNHYGPVFGAGACDLAIGNNENIQSFIFVDGEHAYTCDSKYKKSIFVNTADPDTRNNFTMDEYEVYAIENYNSYIRDKQVVYVANIQEYIQNGTFNTDGFRQTYGTTNDNCLKQLSLDLLHTGLPIYSTISTLEPFYGKQLLTDSLILNHNTSYLQYINNWIEHDFTWKLVFKASRYAFLPAAFHKQCDQVGPTITIIKSSKGYIFGGFTLKSWKITNDGPAEFKDDPAAFIFSLYNPRGIPPTKLLKRKESQHAIQCNSLYGPIFGSDSCDIAIGDNNSTESFIANNGEYGYACDPTYKKSFFVNTQSADIRNEFTLEDYEVYALDIDD